MEDAIVLLEDQIDYCQKAIAGVEPRIIELEERKARWKRQLASYETALAVLRKRA